MHIGGVKDSIYKIVGQLSNCGHEKVSRIRLGMVAYRDYDYQRPFEILDFTSSVEEFRTFCEKV